MDSASLGVGRQAGRFPRTHLKAPPGTLLVPPQDHRGPGPSEESFSAALGQTNPAGA